MMAALNHREWNCVLCCAQGDVSIAMGVPEVMAALKAGQDAGRLPQLSQGASLEDLLKALAFDSLGVSRPGATHVPSPCLLGDAPS